MSEHTLEPRLRSLAEALDADAPALDPTLLRRPRPTRRRLAAIAVAATLAGAAAAPTAVSALADWLDVESVPELGPVPSNVAAGYRGQQVDLAGAQRSVAFRLRSIGSLGSPEAAYMRPDIVGGMVTFAYDGGRIRLTQWAVADVSARAAVVVPTGGTSEEVSVGHIRALWLAGTARATFTVTGADLTTHYELFDVSAGALLWQDGGVAFVLQGAGAKKDAARLAATVGPR